MTTYSYYDYEEFFEEAGKWPAFFLAKLTAVKGSENENGNGTDGAANRPYIRKGKKIVAKRATTKEVKEKAKEIDFTRRASDELLGRIEKIAAYDDGLKKTLQRSREDISDLSQSGYDMSFAIHLKQIEAFSDQEIYECLKHYRDRCKARGAPANEKTEVDYYPRTILNAGYIVEAEAEAERKKNSEERPENEPLLEKKRPGSKLAINEKAELTPAEIGRLRTTFGDKFTDAWGRNRKDLKVIEQYDAELSKLMFKEGFKAQRVLDGLVHFHMQHHEGLRNQKYFSTIIYNARRAVRKENLGEELEYELSILGTEEQDNSPEGIERRRRVAGERVGAPDLEVIRYDGETPVYELKNGENSTKSTDNELFFNQKRFSKAIFDIANVRMKSFSKSDWEGNPDAGKSGFVDLILSIMRREKPKEDNTLEERIEGWIRAYLEGKNERSVADLAKNAKTPFVKDGMWWIYTEDFISWARPEYGLTKDYTLTQAGIDLHKTGVMSKRLNIPLKNGKRSQRVYRCVPTSIITPQTLHGEGLDDEGNQIPGYKNGLKIVDLDAFSSKKPQSDDDRDDAKTW